MIEVSPVLSLDGTCEAAFEHYGSTAISGEKPSSKRTEPKGNRLRLSDNAVMLLRQRGDYLRAHNLMTAQGSYNARLMIGPALIAR